MSENENGSTKKLINDVDKCVDESLAGIVAVNDRLRLIAVHRIVVRADYDIHVRSRRVALLAGGGSGHEPIFAGFVGEGLLTAAVAGSVFTSPPANSILAALRLLGKGNTEGTLVIVANYTGDRLNFGLAVERAKSEGQRVELILVDDDCALVSGNKAVGRRGLCGIALVIKIAGSMADDGFGLDDIASRLRTLPAHLGTIGMCMSPCSLPGLTSTFELADDEMELGLGVHGEAGVSRMKLKTAEETMDVLFTHMTNPENSSGIRLVTGDRVVLLVNNLGGMCQLEMNVAAYEAIRWLESKAVIVERVFVAPLMTSLEMAGISLTVLRVDDALLKHVDSGTSAPGWPRCYQRTSDVRPLVSSRIESTKLCDDNLMDDHRAARDVEFVAEHDQENAARFRTALETACRSLLANRELLNELDRGCGDGDCGNTLAGGAERVLECLQSTSGYLDLSRPSLTLRRLSDVCQVTMGGSSGALYAIFLASAATVLKTSVDAWRPAIVAGFEAITKYGGAEPGDRTMLDALHALILSWSTTQSVFTPEMVRSIAVAVRSAAESTCGMHARAGRATYVNASHLNRPDPGAVAVALIVEAVAGATFNEGVI